MGYFQFYRIFPKNIFYVYRGNKNELTLFRGLTPLLTLTKCHIRGGIRGRGGVVFKGEGYAKI
jgi:hypothetical protein